MQLNFNFPSADIAKTPALAVAFRSGMSRAKDFWGAAQAGAAIGVVAGELSLATALLGVPKFLKNGGHLFIDSGAFSELKTGEAPDFNRVLTLYEDLVESAEFMGFVPSRLYVVSPDKVGDQLETLSRIARYKERVVSLIQSGCKVIVPIQRGVIPAAEMLERVAEILGTRTFVAGIPSNKEAMSIEECATLKHHSFHVLGRVMMSNDQESRLRALAADNPDVQITADANWLRSRLDTICALTDEARSSIMNQPRNLLRQPARTVAIQRAIELETAWGI